MRISAIPAASLLLIQLHRQMYASCVCLQFARAYSILPVAHDSELGVISIKSSSVWLKRRIRLYTLSSEPKDFPFAEAKHPIVGTSSALVPVSVVSFVPLPASPFLSLSLSLWFNLQWNYYAFFHIGRLMKRTHGLASDRTHGQWVNKKRFNILNKRCPALRSVVCGINRECAAKSKLNGNCLAYIGCEIDGKSIGFDCCPSPSTCDMH